LGEVGQPDCIVLAMPPTGLFDVTNRLRRRWRCRVVVDIQDAWPETFYQLLPRSLRWTGAFLFGALRRTARRAYCGADAVAAVAERYAMLARDGGCRGNVGVFPLGTQLRILGERSKERRTDGAALRLCYVGNLGETYDIATMLDGVCRLSSEGVPLTLIVAGDGPQRGRVMQAVAENPAVIRFAGYLAHDELSALLDACDVGVVPMVAASWVAVPNKIGDYAAAGLAMINGLEGEAQTLLDRYQAGLFYRTGDVSSFMDAVRRYAADRVLLERHQQGARRLAEERFDAARIYPEMAKWLEHVVMKGMDVEKRD
jgi:Glycosyltransferase